MAYIFYEGLGVVKIMRIHKSFCIYPPPARFYIALQMRIAPINRDSLRGSSLDKLFSEVARGSFQNKVKKGIAVERQIYL